MIKYYPTNVLPPVPEGYSRWSDLQSPPDEQTKVDGMLAFRHPGEWIVCNSGFYGGFGGVPYLRALKDPAPAPCLLTPSEVEILARASLTTLYSMVDPSVLPHVRKRIEDYIDLLKSKAEGREA